MCTIIGRTNNLKILTLNVNSLISNAKRHEVLVFLGTHKPHVLLLTETKLSACHNVQFRGYEIIRTDRLNSAGGGTAIILRDNIRYQRISTSDWNLFSVECTIVRLESGQCPFYVVSAYSTPSGGPLQTAELDTIFTINRSPGVHSVILGGDLNSRHTSWGDTSTCQRGRHLNRWCTLNAPFIRDHRTIGPTFHRRGMSSFLDLFLATDDIDVVYAPHLPGHLEIHDFASDHSAVELTVSMGSELAHAVPKSIFNYGATDWFRFRSVVNRELAEIECPATRNMSGEEIESVLADISAAINSAINMVVPKSTISRSTQIPLPNDIIALIAAKRQFRRRLFRARHTADEPLLRSQLNCLQKIVSDAIDGHYTGHWEAKLRGVRLDNRTFRNIKALSGKPLARELPAIRDMQTGVLRDDVNGKLSVLAQHFGAVHETNLNMGDAEFTRHVHESVANLANLRPICDYGPDRTADPSGAFDYDRHLVSVNGLKAIIKSRNNKCSSGVDAIPNRVIRKLPDPAIRLLTMVFNQMYNIGYFPRLWKCAKVTAVLKKGRPPSEPGSYRPIALLSCLGKVFEVALRGRIVEYCDTNNVLPVDQFGFRSGMNTTQPLVAFTTDVKTMLNIRTPTIACLLDVEKAFDTVWHDGLVYKMRNVFGFDEHICKMVQSYVTERSFAVGTEGHLSSSRPVMAGVPQGGVLSATLYIIYVADMPDPPRERRQIKRLQYADDILLYVSSGDLLGAQNRLNDYLATVTAFYKKWKIKINAAKSEAIVFKGPVRNHSRTVNRLYRDVVIDVDGEHLQLANDVKYLGVRLVPNMSFVRHLDDVVAKTAGALAAIRPILVRMNGLSAKVKLLCYKQLIRPLMSYAAPVWSLISRNQMNRLGIIERKCLRYCVNQRRRVGPNGAFMYERNDVLYEKAGINRVSDTLVDVTIQTLIDMDVAHPIYGSAIEMRPQFLLGEWKPPWYAVHLKRTGQPHPSGAHYI